MATLSRAVMSLRVVGDELDPLRVSDELGATPDEAWKSGDTIGKTVPRTARFGYWSVRASDTEPADIDQQVFEIVGRLTQDLDAWARVTSAYEVDMFCGWFLEGSNEGTQLGPKALLALGERGIELGLDIYGGVVPD